MTWEFLAELLISFLCGVDAFFWRSWIFVRACHWPTCRTDDFREVGFYVKILFCSPCRLCGWIFSNPGTGLLGWLMILVKWAF